VEREGGDDEEGTSVSLSLNRHFLHDPSRRVIELAEDDNGASLVHPPAWPFSKDFPPPQSLPPTLWKIVSQVGAYLTLAHAPCGGTFRADSSHALELPPLIPPFFPPGLERIDSLCSLPDPPSVGVFPRHRQVGKRLLSGCPSARYGALAPPFHPSRLAW